MLNFMNTTQSYISGKIDTPCNVKVIASLSSENILHLFDYYAFCFALEVHSPLTYWISNPISISCKTVAVSVMRKAIIYQMNDILVVSHGGNSVSDNTYNYEIKTDGKQLKWRWCNFCFIHKFPQAILTDYDGSVLILRYKLWFFIVFHHIYCV